MFIWNGSTGSTSLFLKDAYLLCYKNGYAS